VHRASVLGLAIDWAEALAEAIDDPESRPAGFAEPHYQVSPPVSVSRDQGLYVYHLSDDQLGQGSSLGNVRAWVETKGTGDMLALYSIEAGARVLGGTSITYQLPFSDLSSPQLPALEGQEARYSRFSRAMPTARGAIHLHPAYQQREFVIGDGLHVLETLFVPRTGMDDPSAMHQVVSFVNRSPHPLAIVVVASLDLRGATAHDIVAGFDRRRRAIVAHSASEPSWVRVFGSSLHPDHYCVTTDEELAYNPDGDLPDSVDETGDVTAALQFNLLLLPRQHRKVRLTAAFSPHGRDAALEAFDAARGHEHALRDTIRHYTSVLEVATIEMPDALLTQGVQWAKACLLRPISRYCVGSAVTNDPGRSNRLVGRDTAWYAHGSDFVLPHLGCEMLRAFATSQRDDGLIVEYIDGCTGEIEDHGFNINDNTPLFVMAVAHHVQTTGHTDCLRDLFEPARRAGEAILRARNERGLVSCAARGVGLKGICGWRNVMQTERISGAVTEVNAESYAALRALAALAAAQGNLDHANRFGSEAENLRRSINTYLVDEETGLYVRNIDPDEHVFTQATIDLVFPLICAVADPDVAQRITMRLAVSDFMTPGGIRALPSENPRYDPSFEYGLLGGVWPGATWWYAMGSARTDPRVMADSLHRSYWHYVSDPRVYNTVPGQFSEWSDGQTLVNRGMRLSPWEAPRFLWATIEGAVGLQIDADRPVLEPHLPADWQWLRVANLPFRDERLSFFLTRQGHELHLHTCGIFAGDVTQHRYAEELPHGVEVITTGVSLTVFRRDRELLICAGNALETPTLGPFLAHHTLHGGTRYRIQRLTSTEPAWKDLGVLDGDELQRITVRLDALGYALYRFTPQPPHG
jgi:hypothetical protein